MYRIEIHLKSFRKQMLYDSLYSILKITNNLSLLIDKPELFAVASPRQRSAGRPSKTAKNINIRRLRQPICDHELYLPRGAVAKPRQLSRISIHESFNNRRPNPGVCQRVLPDRETPGFNTQTPGGRLAPCPKVLTP